MSNLVRNYSPHLSPNTQSAPSTAELRKILGIAAQEMLIVFLKKSRTRRSVARGMGAGTTGHPVDVVSSIFIFRNCCRNDEVYFEGSRYGPSQTIRSIWENQGSFDSLP